MELSFWEKNSYFTHIDALIVGSGIVGLNTARALKEKFPDWKILVVDGGFLPYGSSTRNAGFACFGSAGELADDLTTHSADEVFAIVERRWRGLNRLRELLGDNAICYEPLGGYEVFSAAGESDYDICMEKLEYLNDNLQRITNQKNIYSNRDHDITTFGFNNIEHLIFNKAEGQLNTGCMMQALLKLVREMNVEVLNGICIKGFAESSAGIKVDTDQDFSFTAERIIAATNGFAKLLMPELEVKPGRAQVLITSPIKDLKVKGSFHYDKGFYYFRNVENRLLFGGGRNINFEAEETYEFATTQPVQSRLDEILKEVILPDNEYEVEQRWSGIMGLGDTKHPIVKKISDRIYCAVRTGGIGIATGSILGEECAELVI